MKNLVKNIAEPREHSPAVVPNRLDYRSVLLVMSNSELILNNWQVASEAVSRCAWWIVCVAITVTMLRISIIIAAWMSIIARRVTFIVATATSAYAKESLCPFDNFYRIRDVWMVFLKRWRRCRWWWWWAEEEWLAVRQVHRCGWKFF